MSCPIIFNSNAIELTVYTSCFCGLRLTLCYRILLVLLQDLGCDSFNGEDNDNWDQFDTFEDSGKQKPPGENNNQIFKIPERGR